MITNYFKMAWRNLTRNKVSSIINIGGLSVGLATGIIIILVILNELSFDRFHKNLESICLLMKTHDLNGNMSTGPATPGPLAASIRQEIPEVKYAARFSDVGNQPIRAADKILDEQCAFAEPDLFNIMTFPSLEGNAVNALIGPGQAVITASGAMRLFGNTKVLGKTIIYNNAYPVRISAVIKDVPENSSIRFDIVLPFSLYEKDNEWLKKWDDNRIDTWIQLKQGTTISSVNPKLKALFLAKQDEKNILLFAYPFARLRLHDHFKNGQPNGGIIDIVRLLGIIAGFVLLIACINFMNLATARSERRAREVGMRKVLGATRRVIILQFLGEALLMALMATILGIILANAALPGFKQMSGKTFTPDFSNPFLWLLLTTLWLVTGFIAGSYPALYLSKFRPVKVLKKLVSVDGRGGWLRKTLVTIQFFVSIFLIIGTIVIARQISYIEDRPVGYNLDNLIDIRAKGQLVSKFDLVKDQLAKIPGIV